MRHIGVVAVSVAAILAAGTLSAEAYYRGGFHRAGWGGGFHRAGWGGGFHRGWHGGWRTAGWHGGWRRAGIVGAGLGYGVAYPGYVPDQNVGVSVAEAPILPGLDLLTTTTGRSAAVGGFGAFCTTPIKSCTLYQPAAMGAGCTCRVRGLAQGTVTP